MTKANNYLGIEGSGPGFGTRELVFGKSSSRGEVLSQPNCYEASMCPEQKGIPPASLKLRAFPQEPFHDRYGSWDGHDMQIVDSIQPDTLNWRRHTCGRESNQVLKIISKDLRMSR